MSNNGITFVGEALEEVKGFTHLFRITDKQGESDAGLKARIDKAGAAFLQLKSIWK